MLASIRRRFIHGPLAWLSGAHRPPFSLVPPPSVIDLDFLGGDAARPKSVPLQETGRSIRNLLISTLGKPLHKLADRSALPCAGLPEHRNARRLYPKRGFLLHFTNDTYSDLRVVAYKSNSFNEVLNFGCLNSKPLVTTLAFDTREPSRTISLGPPRTARNAKAGTFGRKKGRCKA